MDCVTVVAFEIRQRSRCVGPTSLDEWSTNVPTCFLYDGICYIWNSTKRGSIYIFLTCRFNGKYLASEDDVMVRFEI